MRCGKELQKSFLENRRAFWKKINGKEEGHRLKLGVESKDGILLTEKNRWKEYSENCLMVKRGKDRYKEGS